jgi:hypothetical protein
MKVYKGVFVKKNGQQREMTFAKLEDMDSDFLASRLVEGASVSASSKFAEGMELVWDIESDGFRVFNYRTQIGELQELYTIEL